MLILEFVVSAHVSLLDLYQLELRCILQSTSHNIVALTMADPLSATASILTLIEFAAKSCKSLYDAVQSYQNHPKRVRSLQEELTALHCVLIPLQDFKDETDKTFVVLKAPLLSCGRACEGFEKMLTKYSTHGGTDKRSFRDWASFSFRGSNVEGFTTTIAAYRGTISVALGSANL